MGEEGADEGQLRVREEKAKGEREPHGPLVNGTPHSDGHRREESTRVGMHIWLEAASLPTLRLIPPPPP